MDSGWAAVIGSAVGGLGTFGATWLGAYFARKKPDLAEEAAKQLLRKLLEHPVDDWQHMYTLANVVGTDEQTVRRLLLEIGARGSMRDGALWGLVSRHPLKGSMDDADSKEAVQILLDRWAKEPPSN